MYFLVDNDDLLKKQNTIWGKVNADIKKKFDIKLICNKVFLKTKMKSYGNEVTDFYDKENPKVDSNRIFSPVRSLDSALNKEGNYYPQVFLKECKYIKKKEIRQIIDDLESCSDIMIVLMENRCFW